MILESFTGKSGDQIKTNGWIGQILNHPLYKAADILGFVSPAHATQDCIAATLYRDVKMHAKLGYLPGGPKQVFVEELRFNRGQPDQFDLINVGNSLDDIAEIMPIIMIQAQIYTTQNNFFEALPGKKPGLGDYIFKPGRTAMPSGVWHSTIVTVEVATVLNLLEGTCMPEHVVHRAVSKSFSRHNIKKFALISGEDVVKLGIPEGRRVGLLLDQVRRLQLDGAITSRKEALTYLHSQKD